MILRLARCFGVFFNKLLEVSGLPERSLDDGVSRAIEVHGMNS
jgi:hypothetical protein